MSELTVLDVRTADAWEQWLERNHDAAQEVWLRLLNKNAPEIGVSYSEAVEIALCFGWIDSMTRKYDTPRKPRSPWSKLNIERAQRLIDTGRVREAGLREMDAAKNDGRWQGR